MLAAPCWLISAAWLFFGAGCGDDLDASVRLSVDLPPRGSLQGANSVIVRGTATTDLGRVGYVEVNGQRVRPDRAGRFETTVDLEPGTNVIETIASANGVSSRDRRTVLAGELRAPNAISDGVILRLGSRGLASVANVVRANINLDGVHTALMSSPLVVEGEDCPRDEITVTAIDTNVDQLFLAKVVDVVGGEVLFRPVGLSLEASYTDSNCVTQTGTFGFETFELHWGFRLALAMSDNSSPFIATLMPTSTLYDHELIYTNDNIEPEVFERVRSLVDSAFSSRLTELTAPEIEGRVADWLNDLGSERVGDLGNEDLVVTIVPEAHSLPEAALVVHFAATAQTTRASEPSYVPTPEPTVFPRGFDASMAIADDILDQALGVAWRVGLFDVTLESGVRLELLTPPVVRKHGGRAVVVFGDWVAREGTARVAFSGDLTLGAEISGEWVRLTVADSNVSSSVLERPIKDLERTRQEAEVVLVAGINAILARIALPIAEHVADSLAVTPIEGFVEISIDLDNP